jgi:phosphopantothenoylcysteine decarboxylase/phosphopantothenate--cysteine ligase
VLVKAREKRTRKSIDLMVANDVSRPDAGFEVGTNAVTIIGPAGERELPLQSKEAAAAAILDQVEQLIQTRAAAPLRA